LLNDSTEQKARHGENPSTPTPMTASWWQPARLRWVVRWSRWGAVC